MTNEQQSTGLPRIRRPKPLGERVYEILREKILTGELNSGQRLAEEQLAEQLGVSRTPVREAIQRLKVEGLVVDSDSVRVQEISRENIAQALELRRVLETYACRRAAENMTAEDLAQLKELRDREIKGLSENNLELMSEINSSIHQQILAASGNQVLMHLIDHLQARVPSYRLFALGNRENLESFCESHSRIIDHLEEGDGEMAAQEMSRHVQMAKDVMLQSYEVDDSDAG